MVIPVELDAPLHSIGFEIDVLSPKEVTGRFHVTRACCQRVAGVQLSVNHYQTAVFDDLVFARAEPVEIGQEVQIWKVPVEDG
ncbi:hypothetical protein HPP92_017560 [Vanilla planifolia]|uniref:Thioesterase domain-containing protein n=1 Tax=Vanilla planifolia TaxID=51239 RepID=A0A835USD2_VANPL|nr:hypothetical protein HPP92_017560 [Vanilla planifolia]